MTTTVEERPPDTAVVQRPASGVLIDPRQLIWHRERNSWSRQDLADRVAWLFLDGHPDARPAAHRDEPADGHPPVPERRMAGKARLCTVCGAPVTGGVTRDAIAKIENGDRKPKPATLRALTAALSEYGEPVSAAGMLPGAPRRRRSRRARARDARLRRNQALREFAIAINRPELAWNNSGRARYLTELERLYDDYLERRAAYGLASEPALAS